MQFFFADDSTHKSARKNMGKLVAFGGFLVDGSHLRELSDTTNSILSEFGVPDNEEVKWSPRKGSWIYKNLGGDDRLSCYRRILQAAANAGGRVVVAVCDPEMRNLKAEWGFERCVTYALERVSTFLINNESEAVIICDRPSGGPKQADEFLAAYVDHLASDRNHMVAESFAMNMLTAPSHMVRHLQIADLIVSITTAMVSGNTKWAEPYFDVISNMMLRNSLGYVGGTGLKVYPDQLTNLYYWVTDEEAFTKAGKMAGVTLPSDRYLFAQSDGT